MVKSYITWTTLQGYTDFITNNIRKFGYSIEGIVALARGGYIPAVLLAHNMGLRKMASICLSSYDDIKQAKTCEPILFAPDPPLPAEIYDCQGRNWLIVDDICDTGSSLALAKKLLPQALTATIVVASNSRDRSPDFWATTTSDGEWVVFPWEKDNA